MNIRRIIKEELIKEVGGYDAPDIMGQHAGAVMGGLKETIMSLNLALLGFSEMLIDPNINHLEIKEETDELISLISESIMIIDTVLKDFTEDDLILKGKKLINSLSLLERNLRVLNNQKLDFSKKDYLNTMSNKIFEMTKVLQDFIKTFIETDKMFTQRLQGKNRGWYGGDIKLN